jgi:membrane-bound transcription factor site-1 protease
LYFAKPVWRPSSEGNGSLLKLAFTYSRRLWPWSGYLAISFSVAPEAYDFDGMVEGLVEFEVESAPDKVSRLSMYVRAKIIATPARKQRILWDQFHNLRYPSGYFPRDDLKVKNDPLDWNADHVNLCFI